MTRTRHVLFLNGYDPKNSKNVYAEQKKQIEIYNVRFDKSLEISALNSSESSRLSWSLQDSESKISTQFDLLKWDDLVRESWARSDAAFTKQAYESLWEFIHTSQLKTIWRLSRPLVYAAMLPYALALIAVLLAALFGFIALGVFSIFKFSAIHAGLGAAAVMVSSAVIIARKLRRMPVTWFLRVVAFARQFAHERWDQHTPSHYRQRIQDWAQNLSQSLNDSDAKEILIIGYSAGSILSTALLAELTKVLKPEQSKKIALLTLGNCIPVAACLPAGQAVREDLKTIANGENFWLDITSPTDWGSIFGIDAACAFAQMPASPLRQQRSPRFHTLFSPASYEKLRKDKYRVHQQYLLCSELLNNDPQAYDYFSLLCGSLSLQERFCNSRH